MNRIIFCIAVSLTTCLVSCRSGIDGGYVKNYVPENNPPTTFQTVSEQKVKKHGSGDKGYSTEFVRPIVRAVEVQQILLEKVNELSKNYIPPTVSDKKDQIKVEQLKQNIEDGQRSFHKKQVQTDAINQRKLKRYSVVVATLSQKEGVDRLAKIFTEEHEPVVVVRNAEGLYYFILGSFDESNEALTQKAVLKRKYSDRYSTALLNRKYGISFADIWILDIE